MIFEFWLVSIYFYEVGTYNTTIFFCFNTTSALNRSKTDKNEKRDTFAQLIVG